MKRVVGIALLGCGLAMGSFAYAPPARAANDAVADDAAKARYAEGARLYNKKRYEEARVAFMQSNALKRKPTTTFLLAQCALKLGRWLEALHGYDQFVDEAAEVPEKLKPLVENGRKEAASHLGRLHFDLPDDTVTIELDGEKIARPESGVVDVNAGPHEIVITHRDEKKTIQVNAEAGKTTDVHPTFVPKAIIPTSDTRQRPNAPTPTPVTSEGPAHVEKTEPSIFTPAATMWPVYVMGAIGVAGLGTAAVFGGLASNASHGQDIDQTTLNRQAPQGANCADKSTFNAPDGTNQYAIFKDTCHSLVRQQGFGGLHDKIFAASLITGLAGMAGALTWFFVAPKEGAAKTEKADKPETSFAPYVGPTGAGATVLGTF